MFSFNICALSFLWSCWRPIAEPCKIILLFLYACFTVYHFCTLVNVKANGLTKIANMQYYNWHHADFFFLFFLHKVARKWSDWLDFSSCKKCWGHYLLYQQVIKHHSLNKESWVANQIPALSSLSFLKARRLDIYWQSKQFLGWYASTDKEGIWCWH